MSGAQVNSAGGRVVGRAKRGAVTLATAVTAMFMVMVAGVALAGPSSAQGADPVTAGIGDLKDKIVTYGAAAVGIVLAGVAIWMGVRWLKSAASKA